VRKSYLVVTWLAGVTALAVGFNNCSGVAFQNSPELIKQQQLELQSTSGIQINGGARYTNIRQVQLSLSSPRAVI